MMRSLLAPKRGISIGESPIARCNLLWYSCPVQRAEPKPIIVTRADGLFLAAVAERVLGPSTVAATNAARLREYGFDPNRIDELIPPDSVSVVCENFVFKKVEADPESPHDFGLFVRRSVGTPPPAGTRS